MKKIISILLSMAMIFCMVNPIYASQKNTMKEENVYVNLKQNGVVNDIYVVNEFNLQKDDKIIDYGDYLDIRNLSSSKNIKRSNKKIQIDGKKGKNYYQGKLKSKEIPWNIRLNYYLDGQKINPNDLIGKSGKIKITMDISKNKNVSKSFYDSYMLQTTMYLDSNKCKNIKAKDAIIANNSNNKQLTFLILPGDDKKTTITFDATDFEMEEGITFNALLLSMGVNIDTSILTDSTKQLESAISSLSNGSNTLKEGSRKYNEGIRLISKYMGELSSNSTKLKKGIKKSLDGLKTIESEINKININASVSGDTSGVNSQITNSVTDIVTNEVSSQMQSVMANINAGKDDVYNTLAATNPQLAQKYVSNIQNNITMSCKNVGTKSAESTSKIVTDAYDKNIKSTLQTLASSVKTLKSALKQLERGMNSLYVNYTSFDSGVKSLDKNTTKLYNSYTTLNGGIKTLNNGADTLNNKTSGLNDKVQKEIDNAMEKFENNDYIQRSFVSKDNTNINAVQFVIKTDGIKKEEEKQKNEEENENSSLGDRIKNLFK